MYRKKNMFNESKLKSMFDKCPCCGSDVTIRTNVPYGSGNYGTGANHVVVCSNKNCELMMKSSDTYYVSDAESEKAMAELAERWNKRTTNVKTMSYQIIPGEGVLN